MTDWGKRKDGRTYKKTKSSKTHNFGSIIPKGMPLSAIRVIYDKCGLCGNKLPTLEIPLTNFKAKRKAELRVCKKCKKLEELEENKVTSEQIIHSEDYQTKKKKWVMDRASGKTIGNFKYEAEN